MSASLLPRDGTPTLPLHAYTPLPGLVLTSYTRSCNGFLTSLHVLTCLRILRHFLEYKVNFFTYFCF